MILLRKMNLILITVTLTHAGMLPRAKETNRAECMDVVFGIRDLVSTIALSGNNERINYNNRDEKMRIKFRY